jgi:hypothetical protein
MNLKKYSKTKGQLAGWNWTQLTFESIKKWYFIAA